MTIVREVSCEIRARESVAIIGPSGAGKSTLLALFAGLDLPSSGRVWLAGEDLTTLDEDGRARLRAARVGFVFQSFHLVPALTALENVMLPLELQGRAARLPALEMLERVGLGGRAGHYPRQAKLHVGRRRARLWRRRHHPVAGRNASPMSPPATSTP